MRYLEGTHGRYRWSLETGEKSHSFQCKHTETWPVQSHSLEICTVLATSLGTFHEWLPRFKHCEDLEQTWMKKKDTLHLAETTTKSTLCKKWDFVGSTKHKRNSCENVDITVFSSKHSGIAMQNNVLTNEKRRKTLRIWNVEACQDAETVSLTGAVSHPPGHSSINPWT